MKIDNSIKSVTSVGTPAGDNQRRADKSTATPAPAAENVHLSSLSSQLQAIESNFASNGVIDAGRVEEIKQAISDGHFKVDAGAVADRLLETVRELILSHKENAK